MGAVVHKVALHILGFLDLLQVVAHAVNEVGDVLHRRAQLREVSGRVNLFPLGGALQQLLNLFQLAHHAPGHRVNQPVGDGHHGSQQQEGERHIHKQHVRYFLDGLLQVQHQPAVQEHRGVQRGVNEARREVQVIPRLAGHGFPNFRPLDKLLPVGGLATAVRQHYAVGHHKGHPQGRRRLGYLLCQFLQVAPGFRGPG